MTKAKFVELAQDSKLFAIGRAAVLGVSDAQIELWIASLS